MRTREEADTEVDVLLTVKGRGGKEKAAVTDEEVEVDIRVVEAVTPGGITGVSGELVVAGRGWGWDREAGEFVSSEVSVGTVGGSGAPIRTTVGSRTCTLAALEVPSESLGEGGDKARQRHRDIGNPG